MDGWSLEDDTDTSGQHADPHCGLLNRICTNRESLHSVHIHRGF